MYKRVFKSLYIEKLKDKLRDGSSFTSAYFEDRFKFDENQVLESKKVSIPYPQLILPKSGTLHYDFENSKLLFEAMKSLSVVDATDHRFWTYLSHVTYWDYVRTRSHMSKEIGTIDFILSHWFIESLSATNLLRQDISKLWWVAYLTYDSSRKDPYELTQEAFSMLDYTRYLLPGIQGRNKTFAHALLEFVAENRDLFENNKEGKYRFIMGKANFLAGYKLLTSLNKNEIKEIFGKYKNDIIGIK